MSRSAIRFISYPRTEPPPKFVQPVVDTFQSVEGSISTEQLAKGLTSDKVLQVVRPGLQGLGFLHLEPSTR